MIQTLSCNTFEDLDKGKQFTYEGMCTKDVHEYEQILYSNEWSASVKCKYSNN